MQKKYWNQLSQYKFSLFYLDAHFSRCIKIDRTIKIVLAICSSTAIASWAIWSKIGIVWAIIIAVSQVISVVNEFLPYQKRISEISDMKAALTLLYYDIEHDWFKVANGELKEEEINDLNRDYLKKWAVIDDKYFFKDSLPCKEKCVKYAQNKKIEYFNTMF